MSGLDSAGSVASRESAKTIDSSWQDPDAPTETDATMVAHLMGIPVIRIGVLKCLHEHATATVSEIAQYVGSTRNGVKDHLESLTRLGVISREVRKVPGSFRPAACYQLNPGRAEEIAWLIFDLVAPPESA